MHDIKHFEEKREEVIANLGKRGISAEVVDGAIKLNHERKELTLKVETQRADLNKLSKDIGALKKKGENADELMQKVASIKTEIESQTAALEAIDNELKNKLSVIPNLIAPDVPVGKSEEDNVELHRVGQPGKFSFTPKDHVALGENLGMLDFEAAAKITGARFAVYKRDLAKLERALINFMLDEHGKHGYEEILPPFIVNADSMFGTGQLPKFAEDAFKVEGRDWYLASTAEIPLTNLKKKELFGKEQLPIKYVAYTPCFRSEAGSYGKDTKGLIRLHQFNKVEMVNIVEASESEKAHDAMLKRAENILEMLKLPFRAMLLCSKDIGFCARKCVDLEVWLPGQDKYREISSVSNCWDFQARRASIRYRDAEGKPQFAHTLNGSGLAVGRTVVAIMENYQQEDGSIVIPEVLQPYMGGKTKIVKN